VPSGIRQADPYGTYWDAAGHWRRRLQQQHPYNCRAHQAGGAFSFSTLLPGYYVAGAGWRPRHVHIHVQARNFAAISRRDLARLARPNSSRSPPPLRTKKTDLSDHPPTHPLQAPGHQAVVSQIYFHGDRFVGPGDTACGACQSDHPALITPLRIHRGADAPGEAWSLCHLAAAACAASLTPPALPPAPTAAPPTPCSPNAPPAPPVGTQRPPPLPPPPPPPQVAPPPPHDEESGATSGAASRRRCSAAELARLGCVTGAAYQCLRGGGRRRLLFGSVARTAWRCTCV